MHRHPYGFLYSVTAYSIFRINMTSVKLLSKYARPKGKMKPKHFVFKKWNGDYEINPLLSYSREQKGEKATIGEKN